MKISITPKVIAFALLSQNCAVDKGPSPSIKFSGAATTTYGSDDNGGGTPGPGKNPGSTPTASTKETFLAKINYSTVLKSIQDDVLKSNASDQVKLRYFTLQVPSNAGEGSKTLDTQRKAFLKTINSLSTKSALVKPVALDADKTIYRVNLDDLNMSTETFDKVMADRYPFNESFADLGDAESITSQQADATIKNLVKTGIYAIRMDWFNATATLPILYAEFLEYPENLSDFEAKILGDRVPLSSIVSRNPDQAKKMSQALVKTANGVSSVDRRIANIMLDEVSRTGFNNSGAALSNRLVERHPTAQGSYYITYDFLGLKQGDRSPSASGSNQTVTAKDVVDRTLTQAPLGPVGINGSKLEFQHDGNEIIYTLPNGLFGYFVSDINGQRLDKETTLLIKEFKDGPVEMAQAVANGFSCMSCHNAGILTQADTVLDGVQRNKASLAADDLARINKVYRPAELAKTVEKDNSRYFKAMADLGIDPKGNDPVKDAFTFYNRPLTKKAVIAELDLSEGDFARLLTDPQFNGVFNALTNEIGFVNRGVFQSVYPTVIAKFKKQVTHSAPEDADFLVNVDCMIKDSVFMDLCIVNPVLLNLQAFR